MPNCSNGPPNTPAEAVTFFGSYLGIALDFLPNDNNSIMGYVVEHRIYSRLHHTSQEDATLRE